MEIIIALISSLSAIIIAGINSYVTLKKKHISLVEDHKALKQDHVKLTIELSAITILFNHNFLVTVEDCIQEIFENTKVTRFVIFFAVNGKETFNYVTACYERSRPPSKSGATRRYIRFKIDHDYKMMLNQVESEGQVYKDVEKMPKSLLKSVYTSSIENVKHSVVSFVGRIPFDEHNDVLLYSSSATTSDIPINEEERVIIKHCMERLRSISKHLNIRGE